MVSFGRKHCKYDMHIYFNAFFLGTDKDYTAQSVCKNNSSLQCYSVLSDILVKNELCIPLGRESNVLSTGKGFICLSPASKL